MGHMCARCGPARPGRGRGPATSESISRHPPVALLAGVMKIAVCILQSASLQSAICSSKSLCPLRHLSAIWNLQSDKRLQIAEPKRSLQTGICILLADCKFEAQPLLWQSSEICNLQSVFRLRFPCVETWQVVTAICNLQSASRLRFPTAICPCRLCNLQSAI